MERCRRWLELGVPVLWFPEGTRSFSGALLRFHGGAFWLAAECRCAVVPIVVDRALAVYRGWTAVPFPGRIRVRVLHPVTLAEAGGHGRWAARPRLAPRPSGVDGPARAPGGGTRPSREGNRAGPERDNKAVPALPAGGRV